MRRYILGLYRGAPFKGASLYPLKLADVAKGCSVSRQTWRDSVCVEEARRTVDLKSNSPHRGWGMMPGDRIRGTLGDIDPLNKVPV